MSKILKYILILILIFISFFSSTNAFTYKDVDNLLIKHYQKIDKSIPNIENRIKKYKTINDKIDNIIKYKKNKLSSNNIKLLGFVKISIKNHINKLEKQLEKIDLNLIFDNSNIKKSCGYLNGIFYKDGDKGVIKNKIKISNGVKIVSSKIVCKNGKIESKMSGSYIVECYNGFKNKGKDCVKLEKKYTGEEFILKLKKGDNYVSFPLVPDELNKTYSYKEAGKVLQKLFQGKLLVIQGAEQNSSYKKVFVDDGKEFLNTILTHDGIKSDDGYYIKVSNNIEIKLRGKKVLGNKYRTGWNKIGIYENSKCFNIGDNIDNFTILEIADFKNSYASKCLKKGQAINLKLK